jgi:hypothetical protein
MTACPETHTPVDPSKQQRASASANELRIENKGWQGAKVIGMQVG